MDDDDEKVDEEDIIDVDNLVDSEESNVESDNDTSPSESEMSSASDDETIDMSAMNSFGSASAAFKAYLKQLPKTSMTARQPIDKLVVSRVIQEMMASEGYTTRMHQWPAKSTVIINLNAAGERMACFWDPTVVKIGIDQVRYINEKIHDHKIKCSVVIAQQSVTPVALKAMDPSTAVIMEQALCHNYTKHVLVPTQCAVIDPDAFLKKHHLTREQLPKISKTDPIVRWHGWPVGTIIKSRRVLGGSIEPYDYYRIVSIIKS